MAERGPFEKFLDPDQGGSPFANMLAIIGRGAGVQDANERRGEAISNAMQEFSRLQLEQKLTPQQAFLETIKTEAGQQLLRQPGGIKAFGEAINNATPPVGENILSGPGQTVTRFERGATTPSYVQTNPSQKSAELLDLQKIAQLPVPQLKEIAEVLMLPSEDKIYRALYELEKKGIIDQGVAAKLRAGAFEIKEVKNAQGDQVVGYVVVDKTKPGAPAFSVGPGPQGSVTPQGGIIPATVTPSPSNPSGIADPVKLDMFKGTGMWPRTMSFIDELVRTTLGEQYGTDEGKLQSDRAKKINQLYMAMTSFPEKSGRSNAIIKSFQALAPGLWSSASSAVEAGIQIRQMAENGVLEEENRIKNDPYANKEVKSEAAQMKAAYERILAHLPPMNDMRQLQAAIIADPAAAGVPSAGTAGKTLLDVGKNAVKGAQTEVTGQPPAGESVPLPRARPQLSETDEGIQNIAQMTLMQLDKLDPSKLTPAQRAAAAARVQELRRQYNATGR